MSDLVTNGRSKKNTLVKIAVYGNFKKNASVNVKYIEIKTGWA